MALELKAAEVHLEALGAALAKAERSALLSDHVGVCGHFFHFFFLSLSLFFSLLHRKSESVGERWCNVH